MKEKRIERLMYGNVERVNEIKIYKERERVRGGDRIQRDREIDCHFIAAVSSTVTVTAT